MSQSTYRWVIVGAVAAILGIAFGQIVNGLSVFFTPLESEFGWARADIAAINSFGLIGLALGGLAVSMVAGRVPVRVLTLVGAVVVAGSLMLAARATALWQFYTIFFIAGAVGGSALYAPLFALVGNWFQTGAGLAIGLAAAGQAVGQGAVPFIGAALIDSMGWRGAFTTFGLCALVTLVPLALVLRPAPQPAVGSVAADATRYLPTPLVIVALSVAVLGCCTGMSTPLMHLVPLIEGCGFAPSEASGVLLALMVAAIGGRLAFGKLADMVGAIPAYMAAVIWQTVMIFFFTQINDLRLFYLFAPIYGFGYGGVMTGLLTTARALVPPAKRAMANGIIISFAWLGHGLGGWQGGLTFDLTGGYVLGFADAVAAGAITIAVLLWLLSLQRRDLRGLTA